MKNKFSDILLCSLFCGFLGCMLVLFLLLPRQEFSEKEKRYLAETPRLTWDTLTSGEFGEDVESWLADHIPGRDFLVGFSAYLDKFTGRQVTKDVYVTKDGYLVEAPVVWDEAAVKKNMSAINAFAEKAGRDVDLMIVPSAGFCMEDRVEGLANPYRDTEIIRDIYALAEENVHGMDLIPAFTEAGAPEELFYRTDHHWTSRGAFAAYQDYIERKGREPLQESDFTVSSFDGFYGSTYSRSGLWMTESEPIELWDAGGSFTVTNGDSDTVSDSLFYRNRLEELDKYTVFLDGNHSTVRIENPAAAGSGKLLVIRDSYANCLGTFLANSYETVVLIDLRYYKEPITKLLETEEFTDVLISYSLGNFMTDANIIWLR